MLTAAEVSAHLTIVKTVDLAIQRGPHYSYVLNATEPALRVFRPRCQNCYDAEGVEIVAEACQVLGATLRERRAKPKPRPYVLIDSREQRPLRFAPELGVDCGVATLPAGDYSVRGFTSLIALERKSVADLVQTLSKGRERFENELDLLTEYRWKAILVEGRRGDVEAGIYRSLMTPQSVIGSLRAIWMRWNVPTFWLDSPEGCAREVAWFAQRLHAKHSDLMEKGTSDGKYYIPPV